MCDMVNTSPAELNLVFFESPRISFREIISTKILATYITETLALSRKDINLCWVYEIPKMLRSREM